MNEAMRFWVSSVRDTFYVIGSVAGPHPIRRWCATFSGSSARRAREQILQRPRRLPDVLVACVGGGSNAMGLFYPFLDDPVAMIGCRGRRPGDRNRKARGHPRPRVASGCCTGLKVLLCCRTPTARSTRPTRFRPGSTIPASGPEHALLKEIGRAQYVTVDRRQALAAFRHSVHWRASSRRWKALMPVAHAMEEACLGGPLDEIIVVNLPAGETRTWVSCFPKLEKETSDMNRIDETLHRLKQKAKRPWWDL